MTSETTTAEVARAQLVHPSSVATLARGASLVSGSDRCHHGLRQGFYRRAVTIRPYPCGFCNVVLVQDRSNLEWTLSGGCHDRPLRRWFLDAAGVSGARAYPR